VTWSCLPYTYMLHWTPDCTHDLIVHCTLVLTDSIHLIYIGYDRHVTCGHLILLLTAFITVHLCLYIISVLFQFIVSFTCSHVICTCTFSFTLHAHWVTSWRSWICTSRCWMFYFFDQAFVEIVCFTRTQSFSLFGSSILVFLFIPVVFIVSLISYISHSLLVLFLYSSVIMYRHYMYCWSDIDLSFWLYSLVRLL